MDINISKQSGIKITVTEREKTHWLEVDAITHLTCNGYVSTIHLKHDEQITLCRLLKQFELKLEPYGFMRANRHTLVNPLHIKQYVGGNKPQLVLNNGNSIEVSRRKVYMFKSN